MKSEESRKALQNAHEEAMQEARTCMAEARRAAVDGIAALEARERKDGYLLPDEAYNLAFFRTVVTISTPEAFKVIETLCEAIGEPVSPERVIAAVLGARQGGTA
jgi:hypothetical protein